MSKAKALITLTEHDRDGIELEFSDEVMLEFDKPTVKPDYFQLAFTDGSIFEKSRSLGDGSLTFPAQGHAGPVFQDVTLIDGRSGRQVALVFSPRFDIDDDDVEASSPIPPSGVEMRLIVARSRQDLDRALGQLGWSLGLAGLLLTTGLSALLSRMVQRGLMPLQLMSSQIERLNPSQLEARIDIEAPPSELQPVIARLNDLLARLQKAFEKESRFSADVAHELRTPLAELRSLADVAPRMTADRSAIGRFMEDIQDIALQMNAIVDTLICLARHDSDRLALHLTTFSLADMIEDVEKSIAEVQASRAMHFELDVPDDLMVMADEEKVRLIVRNLVDNACSYAPHGTAVRCRSSEGDEGKVALTISNAAPDLDAADLEMMFDRFWRKDTARTSGRQVGLGLSLVRALAQAQNLTVDVDLHQGEFRIRLHGLTIDHSMAKRIRAAS